MRTCHGVRVLDRTSRIEERAAWNGGARRGTVYHRDVLRTCLNNVKGFAYGWLALSSAACTREDHC